MIQKLVHAYNHTFHRSIQRSPAEVNPSNQEMVWLTLYGSLQPKTPKLKVGDRVRISMMRRRFEKVIIKDGPRRSLRLPRRSLRPSLL